MAGGSTTQFINQKLLEETPIFSKTRVDFTPTHPLTHLVVSNSHIVMALANRTLIRIEQSPGTVGRREEIDLGRALPGAQVHGLFLDPTGHHLLLSLKSSEAESLPSLYYLHKRWSQPRPCSKFRGVLVSAVGWGQGHQGSGTGPLLCGTTLGLIIETELTSDERFFSSGVEQSHKQVFDIGKGQHTPVTGLQYHAVPATNKYFVIATTPTRMYQFQGYVSSPTERPLLQQVFSNYLHVPERFLELQGSLKTSSLSFHSSAPRAPQPGKGGEAALPEQFGWLTEPGLYTGRIDPWEADSDSVTVDCRLLSNGGKVPRSALITQFHVLQLHSDRVTAVCILNEQVVFDDEYDGTHGALVGLSHDQAKNVYWSFTEYAVYKYQVVNESRHVWRIYLEQGQFNLAMRHSDGDPAATDLILTRQAERLFEEGKYVESAMHFAKTRCSFEEVTLRFMALEDASALKNYLKKKLETLRAGEKTQITLIVVWLVEIFQHRLGSLREAEGEGEDFRQTEEEFLALLRQPRVEDCVKNNKETVYALLGSHGDQKNLVHIAQTLRDTDRLVQYSLRDQDWSAVLSILAREGDPELLYTYCPVLMDHVPEQTVDMLLPLSRQLSPDRLLPSLLSESHEVSMQSIRYLEHQVQELHCPKPAVHNLLVSLYVSRAPDRLASYLAAPGPLRCDVQYALRLCTEAGLGREAVRLYTLLGQHEAAVELALGIDTELAASCAAGRLLGRALPEDTSRKLWLKVAKHVVQEKNDIKQAMEFLEECPSVKIEDILPFFPDFVTIDHFKAAICDSLQQYSQHIQTLKEEMAEASASARVIREEIVAARGQHQLVRAGDRCSTCGDLLLSRPFYIFSCQHKFHSACLADAVMPHLAGPRQRKLAEVQQLVAAPHPGESGSLDSKSPVPSRAEQAQAELDDLIASECVFCGDVMIRNIDRPFIEDQDFDRVVEEWL